MGKDLISKVVKTARVFATRSLVLTFDKVEFTYTGLSWKRLRNWFLAELSYTLESERSWAYPTHLQVEPGNTCNLRCPVCHIVTDDKPQGFLALEDFRSLIDEVGEHLLFLHFWGWGEPFLNKNIFSMIRYAKDKGIKIISSTNGHFFDNEENVDLLIDSGLDVLIFALDGMDRETYEKYRHQGDFDKVVRGLRLIARRKAERSVSVPRINLRMLVTRDNEGQVSDMKKLAEEIGVDIFTLKTLCSFDNEAGGEKLLPLKSEYRRFSYDDKGQPVRIKNHCKKPWNHPTVYRDGTVVSCDYHTGRELSLGNAFNNGGGFRKVWFSKEVREQRIRFMKGDDAGLRCRGCSLNFADVDRCVSHAFITAKKQP